MVAPDIDRNTEWSRHPARRANSAVLNSPTVADAADGINRALIEDVLGTLRDRA
jgi:hypothetical protein